MSDNTKPEGLPDPDSIHPRVLAHLGDGVFDLFIRETALKQGIQQAETLHRYTTSRVNAQFQVFLLDTLSPHLHESELEWVRRGRNLPVSTGRRSQHNIHRQATGFETLLGYLYLKKPERLKELWLAMTPLLSQTKDMAKNGDSNPPAAD